MKRPIHYLMAAFILTLTLTGCARLSEDEKAQIKCPACGYEFEMPESGS